MVCSSSVVRRLFCDAAPFVPGRRGGGCGGGVGERRCFLISSCRFSESDIVHLYDNAVVYFFSSPVIALSDVLRGRINKIFCHI